MSEIDKWCEGRSPLLALVAVTAVTSAEQCYEMCQLAHRGEMQGNALSSLSPVEWYQLFRKHRSVFKRSYESLFGENIRENPISNIMELGKAVQMVNHTPEPQLHRIIEQKIAKKGEKAFVQEATLKATQFIQPVIDLMVSKDVSADPTCAMPVELPFFLMISMTCWAAYGTHATFLLRQARDGDYEATQKLLRLDSRILEDPRVRRYFCEAINRHDGAANSFLRAMPGSPFRKVTPQKTKTMLGALILKMSESLEEAVADSYRENDLPTSVPISAQKLKVADIRRLFDAWAKDSRNELRDYDLPEDEHTFYIALTRDSAFWGNIGDILSHK